MTFRNLHSSLTVRKVKCSVASLNKVVLFLDQFNGSTVSKRNCSYIVLQS